MRRRRGTCAAPSCTGTPRGRTNDGTLRNDTLDATRGRPSRHDRRARGRGSGPPAHRARARRRRRRGVDQPALEGHRDDGDDAVAAHRAVALVVHEQHAGVRSPARSGSVSSAPYMSAWPRGSSMSAGADDRVGRAPTRGARASCGPSTCGKPSTMSRSGSPAVWASMVRMVGMVLGARDSGLGTRDSEVPLHPDLHD